MNFRKVNNLVGWITFAIAAIVYLLTMEPTSSLWDCGEFISCAYKVEVGHSPGAPLFMLIQRLFALFAGGNVQKVAMMINAWSAIASALTILFLFWTITHFARKMIVGRSEDINTNQLMLVMGSGMVGALAYTFSDTFWFSAVEGEVYATSSFFTALVFWAILKWEHVADNRYADRWLVLIAYLVGLSVGIHLLNLLAIPALTMVYYFRRYQPTTTGAVTAFVIGCVILGLVQFGVLQGIPILASKFELMFVNGFGLPFDSGAITFLVVLTGVMVWALRYAKQKGKYALHTGILCFVFIVIGFSSYLSAIIRSRADVPIDMTNPDDVISLTSYIQREQFLQQPLMFGPDFTSLPVGVEQKGDKYARSTKDGKDHYEVVGKKVDYEYDAADKRFFPRVWSGEGSHAQFYRNYLDLAEGEQPSSADNYKYFFQYQLGWMWWRYFMWNYAGRQNDIQGHGDARNGNWITGIKAIDKGFLGRGDIDKMSKGYRDSPARNQLYLLPFILGVLGLVFHFKNNKRDALVTFLLFFFTGIATAIYLNMNPLQPRERDYAFAGSTYAFAIWIGLGVMMVNMLLQKAIRNNATVYLSIGACLLAVPVLMASEEWDDHDRSKKTIARASALNVLNTCAPNAILFVYGDNDTYPLWYLQEVEGVRKDIRIVNMSLLGIDWYIDQLNYKVNDADAVPMIWKKSDYTGDKGGYVRYYKSPQVPQDKYFNLVDICKFMVSEDPNNKMNTGGGEAENYYPTKNFFVPGVPASELVKNGALKASDTALIENEMKFTLPKDVMYKSSQAMLNIIAGVASEGWKRPIYVGDVLSREGYEGMDDYLRLEGILFRLTPYKYKQPMKITGEGAGTVDAEKSYDLFMNKYVWGGAERNDVFFDVKNRLVYLPYRLVAGRVAGSLALQGKNKEAVALLDKMVKSVTETSYFYDATGYYLAIAYYQCGAKDKGREIALKVAKNAEDNLRHTAELSDEQKEKLRSDINGDMSIINALGSVAQNSGDAATAGEMKAKLDALEKLLQ